MGMRTLVLLFALLLIVLPTFGASSYVNVTYSEALTLIDSDPSLTVLDVRNQSEYDDGHIKNARLIPRQELEGRLDELDKTENVLVYCQTGEISSTASQILADNGFLHVYNLLGGMTTWRNAGYPTYVKYSSIQEAINNASDGDTVLVSSALYVEHVVVNKSIVLIGESEESTVIDGANNGTIFSVEADNVSISHFNIKYSGCACKGYCGIYVKGTCSNVSITYNRIMFNGFGVKLSKTKEFFIAHNNISNNYDWSIIVANSSNGVITENYEYNNIGGILLNGSHNMLVSRNEVLSSVNGIWLSHANNNTIFDNVFSRNVMYGFYLSYSDSNHIFHNNVLDNNRQVFSQNSTNSWDTGLEGNYWSDYLGYDSGSDGIGDTSYLIDVNNVDNYPLMGQIFCFLAGSWNETMHYVHVVSNSSASNLDFDGSAREVRFYVDGLNDTIGFCRVALPKELLRAEDPADWTVSVADISVPFNLQESNTTSYIYFNYAHSTKHIRITGTVAIPELSISLAMLLFMIAATLAVIYRSFDRDKASGSRVSKLES